MSNFMHRPTHLESVLKANRRWLTTSAMVAASFMLIAGCSSSGDSGGSGKSGSAAPSSGGAASSGGGSKSNYPKIPEGTIKLCGSYPISGQNAAFGSSGKKTAVIMEDLINNQFGGIDGHKVEVSIADDKSSSQTAVDVANQYASDHSKNPLDCPVVYQISQNPVAAPLQAAVLNKAKIVMLATQSPNAFHDPAKYPYFFSLNPSYDALGDVAAHYLIKNNLTKVAVLTDSESLQDSKEYLDAITKANEKQGGNIKFIKVAQMAIGATNVQTQLSELKKTNPDVLLVAPQFGFGPIWSSLKAINWTPKIMGDVGTIYDNFNTLGKLAPGAAAPCWWAYNKGKEIPQNVIDIVDKIAPINGGFAPDPLIASQVSVNQLLLAKFAIEKYHSVDPAALQAALSSLKDSSLPNWWPDLKFDFNSSPRRGPTGIYGPGICGGQATDKISKFPTVTYVDDYRGAGS
jgi:ABC-type branched-subunit amino acid transport system substrate-binding protein